MLDERLDPRRREPVRFLLVGFALLALIGLGLVLWAARDTNPPVLVVDEPSSEIARIAAHDGWSFAPASAAESARESGPDLVPTSDATTADAPRARASLGAGERWSAALRPIDFYALRPIDDFEVVRIDADGSRHRFDADDPIELAGLAAETLLVVRAEDRLPRFVLWGGVVSATDVQRRLRLLPRGGLRIEAEGPTDAGHLSHAVRVESLGLFGWLERAGPRSRADFDRFAADLDALLAPGSAAPARAEALARARAFPLFDAVVALGEEPIRGFSAPHYASPFGRVEVQTPGPLPIAIDAVAARHGYMVQLTSPTPVALVAVQGEEPSLPGTREASSFAPRDTNGWATLYLRASGFASFSGQLPFDAREALVFAGTQHDEETWYWNTGLATTPAGLFHADGVRLGQQRVLARWTEPSGDVSFCDRRFELEGRHVDLGALVPDVEAELRIVPVLRGIDGEPRPELARQLAGTNVVFRLDRLNERWGLPPSIFHYISSANEDTTRRLDRFELLIEREALVVRGLPSRVFSITLEGLELPPHLADDWRLQPLDGAPTANLTAGACEVELPIVVEPRALLRVKVPLEGSLFAPGIRYTGCASRELSDGERVARTFDFRWVDAELSSRADVELTSGIWDVTVAARTPTDHPNHPDEVWYARTQVAFGAFDEREVVLGVEPSAAAVLSPEFLEANGVDDAGAAWVRPRDRGLERLEATSGRLELEDGGDLVVRDLVPDTRYVLVSGLQSVIEFVTGGPGSTVAVRR